MTLHRHILHALRLPRRLSRTLARVEATIGHLAPLVVCMRQDHDPVPLPPFREGGHRPEALATIPVEDKNTAFGSRTAVKANVCKRCGLVFGEVEK